MGTSTHFFYAVKLPSEVKEEVHDKIVALKGFFPFNKWVHQEDLHITLAFLGNAEKGMLDKSVQFVKDRIATAAPFPLVFQGLDIFGKSDSPRIFWLRLIQQAQLNELRHQVFQACVQAGFTLEKRPFQPHVTIARKWQGGDFNQQLLQTKNPFADHALSFMTTEVVLYQTHLNKEPKYEVVHSFKL